MSDLNPTSASGNVPCKTILLVEDDPVVRMLTQEVLEELGYQVLAAEDATPALAILESAQALDLLMTDIGLPGISGRDLMVLARQLRPQLPVLFASGYAEQDWPASDGPKPEKVVTITKPFSLDALRDTVQNLLA